MWREERNLLEDWLRWKIKDEDINRKLENTEEWDSFNIVQFMTEMEVHFGIKVSLDDLDGMQTLQDLLEYINKWRKKDVSH